jgi:hypothetical protein
LASGSRPLVSQWRASARYRDVLRPFPQRRQADREGVDPVVEVLPEASFSYQQVEWPVGGGDEAEIDLDRLVAAEPFDAVLLERAQQLGLGEQGEVADLVEKQRAAVGQLQPSELALLGAGEGPFFVAEQLGLEQIVGESRAVDRLQPMRRAPAQLVDHPGNELLARAGRAEDQDGDIALGGGADPFEDDQHLVVGADQLPKPADGWGTVLGTDRGPPLEKLIDHRTHRFVVRQPEPEPRRFGLADIGGHPERDELGDAILDVEAHPPESLHQRGDLEVLFAFGRQESQQPGAQRGLDQRLESQLDVIDLDRLRRASVGRHGVVVRAGGSPCPR